MVLECQSCGGVDTTCRGRRQSMHSFLRCACTDTDEATTHEICSSDKRRASQNEREQDAAAPDWVHAKAILVVLKKRLVKAFSATDAA